MGNTPSVEAQFDKQQHHPRASHKSSSSSRQPRPPHKLSKPRVGNHASSTSTSTAAGLLSPNGYASATSTTRFPSNPNLLSVPLSPAPSPIAVSAFKPADTIQPDSGATQEEDEYKPPPISKDWYRRTTLFRSKSSQEDRKDRRNSIAVMAPKTGDRLSRANSMTWESKANMDYARQQVEGWNTPGNRQSVNYDMSSYESQRLLGLTEVSVAYENESVRSESQFEVVLEHTWKSSNPHQPASANLSRANSDLSLYVPMRRRSIIQTPGLATRRPGDVPLSRKSSFRHSHPATPGHSRRNSIESSPARVLSLPPPRIPYSDNVERVVTPCESDYKQLGGMKFGSLRITNGAVSPAPSPDAEKRPDTVESKGSNDSGKPNYFMSTPTKSAVGNRKTADFTTTIVQPKPVSRILSPITTSFLQATSIARKPNPLVKTSPTQPANLQPEYLGGLHFSPFSLIDSRPASPELQTTSKHTALEDDLFEDDLQLEYSAVEILDVREDPNAKSRHERPRPDPTQKTGRSVARSDSGFVSSPTSDYSQHKALTKADSGYSSNVSLRSFTARPPVPDKDYNSRPSPERLTLDLPESGSSFLGDLRLPSPTLIKSDDVVPEAPNRTAPAPPLPPKEPSQVSPTKVTMAAVGSTTHIALLAAPAGKKPRNTPSPIDSTKSAEYGPRSAESLQLSPASSDTSTSALSIGSGSHRPGKLFRLLSGAGLRGPPSVHVTHPVNQSIPSVPQQVEARLQEHSGLFPMTTKRLALRTQASKETLKTIFSVGSFDVGHSENPRDSLVSLAESDASGRETPKPHRRRSFQSVPASIMHAAASVIPRNPSHRKPVPVSRKEREPGTQDKDTESDEIQNGFESNVTSIDCIRNSVGNSAFDQAFAAMAEERDVYFSPTGRTMTMTAQLERDLELRMHAPTQKSSNDGLLHVASPISPLMPELMPPRKEKTPPPVSMRTRSVKNLRVPPPLRPQSTPAGGMDEAIRQSIARQNSRESIRSYPQGAPPRLEESGSPPPVPPMNPRRSMSFRNQEQTGLQQERSQSSLGQPQHDQDSWKPNRSSEQGRRGSVSSQGPSPGIQRPASASPYAPQNQEPRLRHRSSYDGHSQSQQQQQQQQQQRRGAPQGRHHPNAPTPSHSGSYYQHQLLQLQQQQWGGDGSDQQGRYPPYVPRTGHHRNRSSGSHSQGAHGANPPPFRILHSYNSPAYRHVPIWG